MFSMNKTILFLIICLMPWLSWAQGIEVFFSPNGGCQQAVISEIKKAAQTIDIAMYYLSSREIAQALVKAQENNVHVRIVLDQGQSFGEGRLRRIQIVRTVALEHQFGFLPIHGICLPSIGASACE